MEKKFIIFDVEIKWNLEFSDWVYKSYFEHRKQYPRNLPWNVDQASISVRMPMEDKFKQDVLPLFQDLFFQRTLCRMG